MAHRSQCSSAGDNPLDPNYLPAHYREEYRLAIDALVEENLHGYYQFLQRVDVVDFLCSAEIEYIQSFVQVPHEGNYGDQQRCLQECEGDSSSDTYWPIHSDLDAPDLDLGWPQLNHFVGPTEVTTFVNPAEHDMPSIKVQARRLIKNAQQVVAIVMDMFTDVDIFAEILDAAMRNVAVYILLDEQNAHHFVNMLSNCRINLESIQYLRVRTVSGISYQCRSGKTLKGQMMDRFLLTDCRAVLSGNYSFMWSFEKLHRCLAHLFLGQLVSTFDEEFRILFAMSQPLKTDNLPAPREDFVPLPERQYLADRLASFRESRKYATVDNPCPDEWPRQPFDERIDTDWKKMPHNRHESPHRSQDPQQLRIGQTYDQSSSWMPLNMMESPNFKRHSYAEGIPGKQTSYQPMQQPGMAHFESQGRPFHRSHHAPPKAGVDAGYSAYDKFRSHYPTHPEAGLPHEMEPPEDFDLVLHYLSSTSNVEMDQMPDTFNPPAELSSGSSRPRRQSLGQQHAYESAPSSSNPPGQTQIIQASNTDRKDPAVRQGLRNWRINSYLNTFDNAGDEEIPLSSLNASDPFEETPNPSHNTVSGPDLSTTTFPNTRAFKVPAATRDHFLLGAQAKITPATSESSLTEADKTDEMEQQEPKDVRPEESFRRTYNVAAQRGSRLRSSLIFSSQLEQPVSQDVRTTTGQQDEDTDKAEGTLTKLPFALQVLGQRRSIAKEPFQWSSYVRSATIDSALTEPSKADDVENKEGVENTSITLLRPSTSQCELSKIDQPVQLSESLLEKPFLDMNDADNRLMFFKHLAAKRKAEQMAESEKGNTDKNLLKFQMDQKNTTLKIEQPAQKKLLNDSVSVTTDSEKLELKKSQTQVSTSIKDPSNSQPLKDHSLSDPVVKDSRQFSPATLDIVSVTSPTESTTQSANELESLKHEPEPSSKESSSLDPSYAEQPASSKSTPSPPNSSESSAAHNLVGVESSLSLSAPLVPSSSSEKIQSNVDASKKLTTYLTRPLTVREPFKWNRNVMSDIFDSTIKKSLKADTLESKEETENSSGVVLRPSTSQGELSKIDQPVHQPQSLLANPTVNMSDADMRVLFFKELAANRKAEKAAAAKDPATVSLNTHSDSKITTAENKEPAVQKPNAEGATGYSKKEETTLCKTALEKNVTKDITPSPPTESPTVDFDDVQSKTIKQKKQSQNDPVPMASCENEQVSSVTMDSEKMELKKSQLQASSITDPSQSTISSQPLKDPNLLEPSVKDGSQLPPTTIEHSELSHVTSPTESSKQSAKESSSSDSSSAEQPASPKSAPLEINTPPTPTPTESSTVPLGFETSLNQAQSVPSVPSYCLKQNVSDYSASQNTKIDPTPSLTQPLSTMTPSTTLESNSTDNKTIETTELAESLSPPSLESSKTSSQTPEEATQSSPPQTVLSSDVKTMKPESISAPTEIPMTLESRDAESNTSSKACESNSKPNSLQTPTEKLPEEPCSLPPSSKTELPETESNSVALESSSSTAVLPSQEEVEDKTNASLSIRLSPPCLADPTENPESLICNIEKELVDSPKLNAADTPSEETQIEKTSASNPDFPPSILTLTQPVSPSPTLAPDSNGSVVFSKPEIMATPTPPITTPSEVLSPPKLSSPDLEKSPIHLSVEQTKPALEVNLNQTPDQTKPNVACEITIESKSITSESCPSESKVTNEKSSVGIPCEVSNEQGQPDTTVESTTSEAKSTDTITETILQDSACPEKPSDQTKISASSEKLSTTTLVEAVPMSPQSKQPKVTQSRYNSSTANVISSSNLRDDTKLLLGQISANSQNRNEPAQELPVTDDDKESKADKNAIGQKDGDSKFKSNVQSTTKMSQDREVLLQKIQTMRKERKVYSRFEMPP